MRNRNVCLVAQLTAEEEAQILTIEALMHQVHKRARLSPEHSELAAKMISKIRKEAEDSLRMLRTLNVAQLGPKDQREYLVYLERFTRTIAAANQGTSSRIM